MQEQLGTPSKENEVTPPKKEVIPPFTARSLLEMCWGMTMSFSHETQQQALGKVFTDEFTRIFKEKEEAAINPEFLQEMTMALSAAVRSIGFIRACHVQYNDFNSDRLTRRRQSFEKMADYSSFSGSGLFAKVGSFVGVGSITELVTKANLSQLYILPFALGGIIGAFAFTAILNWRVESTYDTWANDLTTLQSKYWKEKFKPDVTEQLRNLCVAVKKLMNKYYQGYDDELLAMNDDEVRKFINQNILPPDGLLWPPYTLPPAAETANSSTSNK